MAKSSASEHNDPVAWYVYIVECADDTLYTGVSTNLDHRIATHNRGRGARYTRARLPVTLVYSESATDRSTAQQREYAIKQLSAQQKRALINAQGPGIAELRRFL